VFFWRGAKFETRPNAPKNSGSARNEKPRCTAPAASPKPGGPGCFGNFVDSGDRVGGSRAMSRDGGGLSGHAVSCPWNSRVSRGSVSCRRAAPGQGRPDQGDERRQDPHLRRRRDGPPRLPQGRPGGRSWCPDRRPSDDGAPPVPWPCVCMWASGGEPRPWRETMPFPMFSFVFPRCSYVSLCLS